MIRFAIKLHGDRQGSRGYRFEYLVDEAGKVDGIYGEEGCDVEAIEDAGVSK